MTTTVASSVAADAGVRFEVFDGDLFAWKLEIRDLLALRGYENYLTFTLGTAIRF